MMAMSFRLMTVVSAVVMMADGVYLAGRQAGFLSATPAPGPQCDVGEQARLREEFRQSLKTFTEKHQSLSDSKLYPKDTRQNVLDDGNEMVKVGKAFVQSLKRDTWQRQSWADGGEFVVNPNQIRRYLWSSYFIVNRCWEAGQTRMTRMFGSSYSPKILYSPNILSPLKNTLTELCLDFDSIDAKLRGADAELGGMGFSILVPKKRCGFFSKFSKKNSKKKSQEKLDDGEDPALIDALEILDFDRAAGRSHDDWMQALVDAAF